MAIKRVIYEVDDSPGDSLPTTFPDALRSTEALDAKQKQLTGTQEINDTENMQPRDLPPRVFAQHGRTYSDLVIEFQHSPRAMATLLTIIGFAPFVMRLNEVSEVIMPTTVAAILNSVWFGIPLISRIFLWVKSRVGG